MICTLCNTSGEHMVFQTFEYWYCKTCRDEIRLEEVNLGLELEKEFERMLQESSYD